MAGAFGFVKQPQRGTPSAEQIGQALMQQGGMPMGGMGPGQAAPAPMPSGPGQAAPYQGNPGGMGPMPSGPDVMGPAALRADGARRMTSPGQMPDMGGIEEEGHSANALNIAVGEALTRMGGGYMTNPNPYKPRERTAQNLQQLGLSAIEADLLIRTGGA